MSTRGRTRPIYALAVCALVALCGCKEQILHNLAEDEANNFLTKLHAGAIDAEKVRQADGRWALAVEKDAALPALKLLSDSRLLRAAGREPQSKPSMVSSREEQRFQYERSLSSSIEQTLFAIDGVLDARVHLNLPPLDPLFGQPLSKEAGSASVLLVTSPGVILPEEKVQALVAGASGIAAAKISVLLTPALSEQPKGAAEDALQPGAAAPPVATTEAVTELQASEKLADSSPRWQVTLPNTPMGMGVVGLALGLLTFGALRFRRERGIRVKKGQFA